MRLELPAKWCLLPLQSRLHKNQDVICSFIAWFSDHNLPESDRIAEIIKEDLWPNPLEYYLLHESARKARLGQIRKPVEISLSSKVINLTLENTPIQDPLPFPAGPVLWQQHWVCPLLFMCWPFSIFLPLNIGSLNFNIRPSWQFHINITGYVAWFTLF